MNPRAALVATSIGAGEFLEGYADNFRRFGHIQDVRAYVIPDCKTPPRLYERSAALCRAGFDVRCPDIDAQERFLSSVGLSTDFVPYNSDNRRNVGYLMALANGCEFVISVDDDNYSLDDVNCFDAHAVVTGAECHAPTMSTVTGWFNLCDLMRCEPTSRAYPRGFPYAQRHKDAPATAGPGRGRVRLNAGLWLGEPDLDAISWLVNPTRTTAVLEERVLLGDRAWTPINTQNTALHRDLVVAYYFLRMGYPLGGVAIDRYGDIFSGYFVQKCVRVMGDAIAAGAPAASHRRNRHHYMNDAWNEWGCILVLEDLLPWLVETTALSSASYGEAYVSLSHAIQDVVERMNGRIWTDATRGYFHQMAHYMRTWAGACARVA
jgi:hypothetical protein